VSTRAREARRPARRLSAEGPAVGIRYRIVPIDPHAHLFEVALEIDDPDPDGQKVRMPAWIPGSYLVRDFARHVVTIEARAGTRRLDLAKIDRQTWQAAPCRGTLRLLYRVYAWDLSVRAAHLDANHGFFNATSVFLQVAGRESRACAVRIEPPPGIGGWRVATTLPRDGARAWSFGDYRARDYDELADHPVEMGRFTHARFMVAGVAHDIVITGRHDADLTRLARDLQKVCAAQARLFEPRGGKPPFERYLFLVMAVDEGYGGLEHRSSTALLCPRHELPHAGMKGVPDSYRGFLALASHEYFHAWHVKRIRPAALVQPDLSRENPTRLLWIFEGFTSYYDELMLARCGLVESTDYLKALGQTISQVLRGPGRLAQSVAESSFDAWIKYYRPDENSPNAVVSYYAKGALVALCLDLEIRRCTEGARSLDDVMRLLWRRFGRAGAPGTVRSGDGCGGDGADAATTAEGLAENGFAPLVLEATGVDVAPLVEAWAEGTGELPLAAQLRAIGITLELEGADDGAPSLGLRLAARPEGLAIATALQDQAGMRAGLSGGDVLVALDGLRVRDEKSLKSMLARRRAGDIVKMHAFRRDELFTASVRLQAPLPTEATLKVDDRAPPAARLLRRGWLGPRARGGA
jgi:predicted metalloprotease with PDZ domain